MRYFKKMLKYLLADSLVIMDNASSHSRRVEKTPTSSWKKQETVDWFTSKDIPFQANIIKKELQSIVNLHKHRFMKYAVEDIAEKYNSIVLLLPHCELNPIELMWVQVKGFVATRNVTFKMKHVNKEKEKMWDFGKIIGQPIDPLIIILRDEDTSSDDKEFDFL